MVRIILKPPSEGDVPEWLCLELQGTLMSTKDTLSTLKLGDLTYTNDDTVQLLIGKHKLTGKVKKLPKPFVVLDKRIKENVFDQKHMEIKAVIRRKICFTKRPQIILAEHNPPTKIGKLK